MTATDYYVKMGVDHTVCQDYGVAGKTKEGNAYAVISDGCSAVPNPRNPKYPPGYPFTDYGSRLVVRGTVLEIQSAEDNRDLFNPWNGFNYAVTAAKALNLVPEALDATLVMTMERDDSIHAHMFGDGVIITRTREGVLAYTTVEFENNAPYYLNYVQDNGRRDMYHQVCKSQTITYRRRADGKWEDPLVETTPVEDWGLNRSYPKDNFDLVLVASDGLNSFVGKEGHVPLEDVLDQLCTFKNFQGEFLMRRLNFFQKTCLEKGWTHYDDVSIAGIHVP